MTNTIWLLRLYSAVGQRLLHDVFETESAAVAEAEKRNYWLSGPGCVHRYEVVKFIEEGIDNFNNMPYN